MHYDASRGMVGVIVYASTALAAIDRVSPLPVTAVRSRGECVHHWCWRPASKARGTMPSQRRVAQRARASWPLGFVLSRKPGRAGTARTYDGAPRAIHT